MTFGSLGGALLFLGPTNAAFGEFRAEFLRVWAEVWRVWAFVWGVLVSRSKFIAFFGPG